MLSKRIAYVAIYPKTLVQTKQSVPGDILVCLLMEVFDAMTRKMQQGKQHSLHQPSFIEDMIQNFMGAAEANPTGDFLDYSGTKALQLLRRMLFQTTGNYCEIAFFVQSELKYKGSALSFG